MKTGNFQFTANRAVSFTTLASCPQTHMHPSVTCRDTPPYSHTRASTTLSGVVGAPKVTRVQDILPKSVFVIVNGLEIWLEQHFLATEAFGANSGTPISAQRKRLASTVMISPSESSLSWIPLVENFVGPTLPRS